MQLNLGQLCVHSWTTRYHAGRRLIFQPSVASFSSSSSVWPFLYAWGVYSYAWVRFAGTNIQTGEEVAIKLVGFFMPLRLIMLHLTLGSVRFRRSR